MQGAARTGAERTGSYVSTGSTAATQQMAVHGQAPYDVKADRTKFHISDHDSAASAPPSPSVCTIR